MAKKIKKTKSFFRPMDQQGSILAFSLIVMFVLMIIAIGVVAASIKERKTSAATGKSITAYQAADSGAETALDKIIKDKWTVDDFNADADMECHIVDGAATVIASMPRGEYALTFEDDDGIISECDNTNTIIKIKSSGNYAGIKRAVEVSL